MSGELSHVLGASTRGGLIGHGRKPLHEACLEEPRHRHEHQADSAVATYKGLSALGDCAFDELTVDRIEPGIDGYTVYLTDSIGGDYTAVISIPNLEDAFVPLEIGDVVTISGDYAESFPVRIINITNITVEAAIDRSAA